MTNSNINNSILTNNKINGNTLLEEVYITRGIIGNSHILNSLLSNVFIEGISSNIDYTENTLNGQYSKVIASRAINIFQCVEVFVINSKLRVQPTDPASRNSFFGIAQNACNSGQSVNVLTDGISKLSVRINVNLPVLTKINSQYVPSRDKNGKIITQSVPIPINKNDLLVLAGTNSDILVGPLTQYYQFNAVGNDGLLTVYKSIQINPVNGTYNINYTEQNTVLGLKQIKNGTFIQVLDIDSITGEIIGYLI